MKIEIECIDLTKGAKLPNLPASKGAFPTNGRADMTQTCFMSYLLSVPLALDRKHKYKSKYLGIGYRFSWSHHEKKKIKTAEVCIKNASNHVNGQLFNGGSTVSPKHPVLLFISVHFQQSSF